MWIQNCRKATGSYIDFWPKMDILIAWSTFMFDKNIQGEGHLDMQVYTFMNNFFKNIYLKGWQLHAFSP